jgi:uncharacterized membrane protein (TIGR02234 family)
VTRTPRREYLTALLLGAAGAAVVLLAARQEWARVVTAEPRPLPSVSIAVRGQDVLPAAGALGLAALAGLAAVLATRRLARRAVGGLLVVFGATIMAVAGPPLTTAQFRVAATHPAATAAGGTAGGGGQVTGLPSHVVLAAFPWRWATLLGAVLVVAAGLLVAWRGAGWPVMSSRYEQPPTRRAPAAARPGGGTGGGAADPAVLWESLNQGIDPTEPGGAGPSAGRGLPRGGPDV